LGTFTRAAHSIKGSSANLGAQRLRAVAETLEHDSRVHGLGGLSGRVEELKAQFSHAESELKKITGAA
jgi:HPt (histidine-containing phosphotransfer) domain-containing protein